MRRDADISVVGFSWFENYLKVKPFFPQNSRSNTKQSKDKLSPDPKKNFDKSNKLF